ncbi:hypothetical protein HYALB_00004404 [Hymenoscyphus albidus]|uniref:DUF7888 domain-containing protein n=1 Tax=Hymenoscyphus albidus TaxID=595503 RepID=A0A9N9LL75_9HELO|nr:hypothetical protein HYALB_00004404 [Hymenoscyphus albidus]
MDRTVLIYTSFPTLVSKLLLLPSRLCLVASVRSTSSAHYYFHYISFNITIIFNKKTHFDPSPSQTYNVLKIYIMRRSSIVTAIISCLSSLSTTTASLIPIDARSSVSLIGSPQIIEERDSEQLKAIGKEIGKEIQKQVISAVVSSAIAGAIGGGNPLFSFVAKQAVKQAVDVLQDLGEWDGARQKFTQEVTAQMWDMNPSPETIVATVCYNKGYDVSDTSKIVSLMDVDFKLGKFNTDYDCMYLEGPIQFWTRGDGGYQNLCYRKGPSCSYDDNTGDLNCATIGQPPPGNGDPEHNRMHSKLHGRTEMDVF